MSNEELKHFIAGAITGYLDSYENINKPCAAGELFKIVFNNYDRKTAADICLGIIGAFFEYYDNRGENIGG